MKTLTKLQELLIEATIENFPFAKVHKAMVALNWTWTDSESVPSIKEMKATAKRLLTQTIILSSDNCSSGGLAARYHEHPELEPVKNQSI